MLGSPGAEQDLCKRLVVELTPSAAKSKINRYSHSPGHATQYVQNRWQRSVIQQRYDVLFLV